VNLLLDHYLVRYDMRFVKHIGAVSAPCGIVYERPDSGTKCKQLSVTSSC
jgi:hypothetical protein